jgi:hypothetical protein
MVFQKIINKKAASSLTSLGLALLLAIGIFTGMYTWLNYNTTQAGVTIGDEYSGIATKLNTTQNSLNDRVELIKSNLNGIQEAKETWQVAWNGLKGLGNVLLLPITFITYTIETYTGLTTNIGFIPGWVKVLATIGITLFIVFLILKVLTGGNPNL